MSLSAFIRAHREAIIVEFGAFARTLMPLGAGMSEAELRDHAEDMLTAVVQDIGTSQSAEEQSRKSRGHGDAQIMKASGRLHADDRIKHGFTLRAVLAEFRALRATVLRLYEESGATDLKEVRRFNESVDEALTESLERYATQADLFRDQFIGVLSHDLRTPLGAITAGAALLAVPEDNPQRRGRVAARILNSAQRMERMIGDLLDLTRARLGGKMPIKRQQTDLQKVCEMAVAESGAAHPEATVRLQTRGHVVGSWDADRLAQVVSNLISNAIQHGSGTPITIHAEDDGNAVTLTVHNGGAPIPEDLLPSLFEPLARGGSDGGLHNLGLGLFIARAVVSAHGGEITVTSSADLGTTFIARLPKSGSDAATASVSG